MHKSGVRVSAVGFATMLAVGIILALVARSPAGASTWSLSSSEASVASKVAHMEAASTIPGLGGLIQPEYVSSSGWPSNVASVETFGTTQGNAETYVDERTSNDPHHVVVLRFTGRFEEATTGPKGSAAVVSGSVMTVIADSVSGAVVEFSLGPYSVPISSVRKSTLFKR